MSMPCHNLREVTFSCHNTLSTYPQPCYYAMSIKENKSGVRPLFIINYYSIFII